MFVLVLSVTAVRDRMSNVVLRLAVLTVKTRVKLQGDILGMTSMNGKELKDLQNKERRRKED